VDQPPAIELRGLARHFGERTALRNVSVSVPAGATLAVLGHNGAGKSTLLRILATLLRPHDGEVVVLGEPLPRRAFAVRGRLGLLAHEPLLYRDLSGRENLQYHARLHGATPERVEEVLAAVGMERRAEEPVRQLSRGMVQRLAVCRAVLHKPKLLLLDEPRANLDPAASDLVEPLIGRAAGATRVLTSHDPQAALAEADLVLALRQGRPAFVGEPGQLDSGKLAELYG
jgi:heme exporter protein A